MAGTNQSARATIQIQLRVVCFVLPREDRKGKQKWPDIADSGHEGDSWDAIVRETKLHDLLLLQVAIAKIARYSTRGQLSQTSKMAHTRNG